MASHLFYHTLILVLYVMLQFPTSSGTKTSNLTGFSTYLIHRDSIESPFYNSSLSQSDLVERAIHRSRSRFSHLKTLLKLPNINGAKDISAVYVEARIMPIVIGEYLMEFSVGTPRVKQWATLDTASGIVWTQCLECINCYEQTQPKFDPRRSSSYQPILCQTPTCRQLGAFMNCRGVHRNCKYQMRYEDNSYSFGELATETFKLGRVSIPNMVYGCSNNNVGIFEESTAGIVGMSNEPLSLVNRLPYGMGSTFSYCISDPFDQHARGKISFGTDAILSGMSTPLVLRRPPDYYFITMEWISVNNRRFPLYASILLDTGSYLTYLPEDVYQRLANFITREIQETPMPPPPDTNYKLCYRNTNFFFPTITFHFSSGAYLEFSSINTFRYIGNGDLWCLTIAPADEASDNLSLLGNALQSKTMIGYDIDNEIVSFTPNSC